MFGDRLHAQSAMEYLMTYGWAILIIAVVLALLFQLGIFSGGNFAPRAQAGACQVQQTSAGASLVGECQGQLPKFVLTFTTNRGTNNLIAFTKSYNLQSGFTVTTWYYSIPDANCGNPVGTIFAGTTQYGTGTAPQFGLGTTTSGYMYSVVYNGVAAADPGVSAATLQNTWDFAAMTYNDNTVTTYFDGSSASSSFNYNYQLPTITYAGIGYRPGQVYCDYYGSVSNVQLYNTSLTAAEVNALYLEGIGGAPVRPQNLVGWWPLNGDLNDYSGNNNAGSLVSGTFTYTSAWSTNYTAP